jgi:hypothetical protein
MKRLVFPIVLTAIIAVGIAFSSSSNASRTGVNEVDLMRSGHTVDYSCGAASAEGAPVQLAAVLHCEEFSDGSCVTPGQLCGTEGSHKKKNSNFGNCATVINKQKQAHCACVR